MSRQVFVSSFEFRHSSFIRGFEFRHSSFYNDPDQLLEMNGIIKRFPGVVALGGVSLHVRGGEVLSLMGENGAGKSTLMKILGGAYQPDEGELKIDGQHDHLQRCF